MQHHSRRSSMQILYCSYSVGENVCTVPSDRNVKNYGSGSLQSYLYGFHAIDDFLISFKENT